MRLPYWNVCYMKAALYIFLILVILGLTWCTFAPFQGPVVFTDNTPSSKPIVLPGAAPKHTATYDDYDPRVVDGIYIAPQNHR